MSLPSTPTVSAPPTAPPRRFNLPIVQSFSYYIAFIALGLSSAVFGPALTQLSAHTQVTLSTISTIFIANALGRTIGSFFGGRLYDRLPGHPVIAGAFTCIAIAHVLLPASNTVWVLLVLMFLLGLAEGTVDVGCNTLIIQVHGKNVGPYMNALHFTFGLGAFLMPPVVALSMNNTGDVTGAFWFIALVSIPVVIWFARLTSPAMRTSPQSTSPTSARNNLGVLALFAVFFFFFVGVETEFGSWTFNFGKGFALNETSAALLSSTYFGGFTVGRLISIPLAARIRPRTFLILDVVGMLLGSVMLVIATQAGSEPSALLWIAIFVIGLSVASCFPVALSFAEERLQVTGKVAGLFLATSNIGVMFFPWLIGQFFESRGSASLTYISAITIVAAAILFVLIVIAMRRVRPAEAVSG